MIISPLSLYLAQTALAVSLLIALVLIVRRPFAKRFGAQAAYTLWGIPLLRIMLPPMPADWTLFGLLQPSTTTPPAAQPAELASTGHTTLNVLYDAEIAQLASPLPASAPVSLLNAALPSLYAIWIIGTLAALILFYVRQASFSKDILSTSAASSPSLQAKVDEIKSTLGLANKTIPVRISPSCQSPLVTGLISPIILVSDTFERDYTAAEQHSALSHELMHIKRRDLWSLLAAIHVTAAQWFNPLAWMALKAFRTDQEAACDADVLAHGDTNRQTYGATLVKAARISSAKAEPMLAPNLPLNHALYERLNTMTNPLPSPRKRKTGSLLTATIGAAALIASACATSTAQEADADKTVETIITKTQTKSVIVNQDGGETKIVINGKELTPEEAKEYLEDNGDGIQTFRIEQGGQATAVKGARVLFLSDSESERPDATEFANEMRRLAQNPTANAAAMTALADDFQARMEAWKDKRLEHIDGIESSVHHGTFTWHTDGIDSECGDQAQIRTVIVEKADEAGEESRIENIECGTIEGIDADALIEQLRENSELTEERLEEVRERLENLHLGETGQKRVRVEIDTETTDD